MSDGDSDGRRTATRTAGAFLAPGGTFPVGGSRTLSDEIPPKPTSLEAERRGRAHRPGGQPKHRDAAGSGSVLTAAIEAATVHAIGYLLLWTMLGGGVAFLIFWPIGLVLGVRLQRLGGPKAWIAVGLLGPALALLFAALLTIALGGPEQAP